MTSTATDVRVLIDVDSVSGIAVRTRTDAASKLHAIGTAAQRVLAARFPAATFAELRLYSAWKLTNGRDTDAKLHFTPEIVGATQQLRLAHPRGARLSFRMIDRPANANAPLPPFLQYEARDCCGTSRLGQKTVDTLLCVDAVLYAIGEARGLVIMSRDRDMGPAALAAASARQTLMSSPGPCPDVVWDRPGRTIMGHEGPLTNSLIVDY